MLTIREIGIVQQWLAASRSDSAIGSDSRLSELANRDLVPIELRGFLAKWRRFLGSHGVDVFAGCAEIVFVFKELMWSSRFGRKRRIRKNESSQ